MTISSALAQTYPNIEIIVVDNCSLDNTVNKVKFIQKKYKQIQLYQNETNLGMVGNWNQCIKYSKGEFINILHADDLYSENIIGKQAERFLKNPDLGIIFTLVHFINNKNNIIGNTYLPEELYNKEKISYIELVQALMKNTNSFLTCPSAMIKRSVLEKTGYFNVDLRHAVDLDMWLRIAKNCDTAIIDDRLMYYRISENQATTKYHDARVNLSEFFEVLDSHIDEVDSLKKDEIQWTAIRKIYSDHKLKDYVLCYINSIITVQKERQEELKQIILGLIDKNSNDHYTSSILHLLEQKVTIVLLVKLKIKRSIKRLFTRLKNIRELFRAKVNIQKVDL